MVETTMAKKWRALYNKIPADRRAKIEAQVAKDLAEMPLRELRRARELSQVRLAETLETTQSEVSKIERRSDLYVSTLRSYIEAMGGDLEIVARFPDGAVRINQFKEVEDQDSALAKTE